MQPEAYKAAVTTLAKNNKVPIAPPNSPPESCNLLVILLNLIQRNFNIIGK